MPIDPALKAKQNLYEDTVIHYMNKEDGHVIVLSDDQAFSTQLRLTLAKELGLSSPNMLTALSDPHQLLRVLREVTPKHPAPMLFLERIMGGQDLSFLVNQIKQAYSKLRIIILTTDVQRDRLMLLHEVSVNTLIEKMAFTLKPQSKLGQAIDLAKSFLAHQKYAEALAACQKILTLKPGSAAAYLVIGDTQRAMKDYEKARVAYETAAKSADLYLAPLQRLAEMYEELGDQQSQLRCLQKLDTISPLNVNRKVSLGEIHLAMGEPDKIAPEDENLYYNVGMAFAEGGDFLQAKANLLKAVDLNPDIPGASPNIAYNFGAVFLQSKDRERAAQFFKLALQLRPDFPAAQDGLKRAGG